MDLPRSANFAYVQQATRLIASARSILFAVAPEAEHTCRHLYALNLWLQGRCLLLQVAQYHNKSSGQHYAHLQHLFRRLHLTPSKYTFTFFNSTGVCYVRVTTSQMHKAFSYAGCSTGTLTTRESNRNRKFQQLQNQAIVHAELALRWWKKHNNYHQYVPLTIQHSIPTPDLQTVEAAYIQQLPRLNYTYIHRHLKSKLSHFHQQKQAVTKTGFASIWCKIRRKHLPQRLRSITQAPCFRDQRTAWQTLVNLSSNTRRRFDTTKQLMKHSTASPAIYALYRMTHNMAPTHQRTARKSLATALTKRKLPIPKGVAPLLTFPLGHASFQTDVRQFLRERVSQHRDQTCLNMDEVMHTPAYAQPFLMMSLGQTITLDIRYDGVRFAEHERDGGQHYQRALQQRFATFHTRRILGAYGHHYGQPATPTHAAYLLVLQDLQRLRSTYPIHIEDFLVDQFLHRVYSPCNFLHNVKQRYVSQSPHPI